MYRTPESLAQRKAEVQAMIETTGRYDYLPALEDADAHTLVNLHVTLWQEIRGRPARR